MSGEIRHDQGILLTLRIRKLVPLVPFKSKTVNQQEGWTISTDSVVDCDVPNLDRPFLKMYARLLCAGDLCSSSQNQCETTQQSGLVKPRTSHTTS